MAGTDLQRLIAVVEGDRAARRRRPVDRQMRARDRADRQGPAAARTRQIERAARAGDRTGGRDAQTDRTEAADVRVRGNAPEAAPRAARTPCAANQRALCPRY